MILYNVGIERKCDMPPVLDVPIKRCRPSEDAVPFSECRNNFSSYISRTRETHRPILVTQNGRASSYLVDAGDFDALMEKIDLWNDVSIGRREIAEGKGIPNDVVFDRLTAKLMKLKKQGH